MPELGLENLMFLNYNAKQESWERGKDLYFHEDIFLVKDVKRFA